jgi:exopolysaccharide biosynthesis polyprenyl glycosylphosphotransferase
MAKQRMVDLWIVLTQVILDLLLFYFSFYLAFWVRFHSGLLEISKGIPSFHAYLQIFPVAALVMTLVLKSMGLYDRKGLGSGIKVLQIVKAISLGMFILMSITFIYRDITFSRLLVVVAWFLCISFILIGRFSLSKFEKWLYKRFGLKKKILLIGGGELFKDVVASLEKASKDLYKFIGALVEGTPDSPSSSYGNPVPILGSIKKLPDILSREKIDEVILAVPDLEQKKIVEIILACEKEMVRFRMIPDIFEILTSQVEVENFYGVTLLGLKQFPLEKAMNRFLKRAMDVFGASFGLVLCFPLFLILFVLIKRDSSGPVFYRQERVGEDGRKFTMVKFRTMIENAEEKTGPVWTSEKDSRRTQLGQFLRRYNLDELPQLWNVLKGEMSLVGPRPERPYFVNEFKDRVPRYMSRHKIKSGMTGWAQVNGLRGNTSILERVKYDLYYLENWSVLFDIKIICKTFLSGKNAY